MSLVLQVQIKVKPENVDAFMKKVIENAREARSEPGCRQFEVLVDPDDKTRLIYAFRLATARKPSGKEVDVLRGLLDGRRDVFRKDRPSAVKLLGVGESPRDRRLDPAEHAAWTTVASVILNLDEKITKQ